MFECNPQQLFGWYLSNNLVEPILIPYNNSLSSDSFRQLINTAVPTVEKETWNQVSVINKSPGRLTVHIACVPLKDILGKKKSIYLKKSACAYRIYCSK